MKFYVEASVQSTGFHYVYEFSSEAEAQEFYTRVTKLNPNARISLYSAR